MNLAISNCLVWLLCLQGAARLAVAWSSSSDLEASSNNLPIVGVLAQELYPDSLIAREFPDKNYTSYIAASYVKFIEGAGGRVVPLWIGQTRDYYVDMLSKINGVLLPGGGVWFNDTAGYGESGEHIIRIAMELNDRGIYLPVWGTCLGMELLVYVLANHTEARTDCNSTAQALPLKFVADFQSSRMFGAANVELINIWQNSAVTVNWHRFCYTQKTFATMRLNDIWRVMSLNHDWNGIEYISTIEHRSYPFYGTQFHPEKNLYEFATNRNITHTANAVLSSQYFANFIITEARKNTQKFNNASEETSKLIFNYKPEFTGAIGSSFTQQYLFEASNGGVGAAAAAVLHNNWLKLFGFICGFLLLR